jgi:hypothetical protein
LTGETILQTLERVSAEVKHDEAQRTKAAVEAQLRTRKELENETSKTARLRERIYWKCDRQAKQIAWSITAFVVLVLVIGLFAGLGIRTTNKMGGWLLTLGSGFSLLYGFVRSIWGVPVMNIQGKIYKYAIKGLLLRESRAIGLNVEESVED